MVSNYKTCKRRIYGAHLIYSKQSNVNRQALPAQGLRVCLGSSESLALPSAPRARPIWQRSLWTMVPLARKH